MADSTWMCSRKLVDRHSNRCSDLLRLWNACKHSSDITDHERKTEMRKENDLAKRSNNWGRYKSAYKTRGCRRYLSREVGQIKIRFEVFLFYTEFSHRGHRFCDVNERVYASTTFNPIKNCIDISMRMYGKRTKYGMMLFTLHVINRMKIWVSHFNSIRVTLASFLFICRWLALILHILKNHCYNYPTFSCTPTCMNMIDASFSFYSLFKFITHVSSKQKYDWYRSW
jgi:hypothetical protein